MEDTMMKNLSEMAFILDRSGSMAGLESDTIGGFNAFLEKQKALPGEARLTTVLFSHRDFLLHDRLDIRAVSPITEKEYSVGGSTALLDAVGRTIDKIERAQQHTSEAYRADNVLVVITTDGLENASREYTAAQVKQMIERQKSQCGWEFLFLGANIDAVEAAGNLGIAPDRAQNYCSDSEGTLLNFRAVSAAAASFRASGEVDECWSEAIRADYKRRGGKAPKQNG
jgi:uncharacterized protein YegL